MKPTITEDAFRKALSEQFKHAPDGAMTCAEIAAHIGVGNSAALARVKVLMAAGTIEYAGKVTRQKLTGEPCSVPAYRLTGKAGKK